MATISDALKRADDPVHKQSLTEFYTRISASTGVGALSKFIPGLDEKNMSLSDSKTGVSMMPSSSSCAGDINMKIKKGQLETAIGINSAITGEQRAELQEVVTMLETEFNELNKRYRCLLKSARDDAAAGKQESMSTCSEELLSTIRHLQQKGYQLHLMRRGLTAPEMAQDVRLSPKSAKRKAAALKILHDFRRVAGE